MVVGDPAPDTHWTYNGQVLLSGGRISTQSIPVGMGLRVSITITDIQLEDRGVYKLHANNTAGQDEWLWYFPVVCEFSTTVLLPFILYLTTFTHSHSLSLYPYAVVDVDTIEKEFEIVGGEVTSVTLTCRGQFYTTGEENVRPTLTLLPAVDTLSPFSSCSGREQVPL